jgi:threonine dehydrogenase-like Zn-dependent dehydrogenase
VTWAGNPTKENVVAEIQKLEPAGLDVVFEACGQPEAVDQAIDMLKPGGTLIAVGIPEIDWIPMHFHRMRRKELTLRQVRRQCECQERALELVEKEKLDVDFMVTHHYKLDEIQKAFEIVDQYSDGVIKAMIEI